MRRAQPLVLRYVLILGSIYLGYVQAPVVSASATGLLQGAG